MNAAAFRLEPELGIVYASDTRGHSPFLPVVEGCARPCPQLPTTLPTLDEVIGVNGITVDTAHEHLLSLTGTPCASGHVYTLHAELEGQKLLPVFERLLAGWSDQGHDLVSLGTLYAALDSDKLPRHPVVAGNVSGRSGSLCMQMENIAS
jgi:hypothetical protein